MPTYRVELLHVRKRAQGGSDFYGDGLIALCHDCPARTDPPFCQRLIGRHLMQRVRHSGQ